MKKIGSYCISFITVFILGLSSTNARAQGSGYVLEEITVTARKRGNENLQDVSESITALTATALKDHNITNFRDYATLIPGLSFMDNGPGQNQIVVRGITTGFVNASQVQNNETAGLYLNDTPVSINGSNPEFILYDMERIEVLRGPQGTLYGAGAMSGTVRLLTKKPVFNEFEASIEASISDTKHGGVGNDVKAAVNIPIIDDELAVRVVAYNIHTGGVLDNVATSDPVFGNWRNDDNLTVDKDADAADIQGGRLHLKWEPTDKLSINLNAIYQKTEYGLQAVANDPDPARNPANTLRPLGPYEAYRSTDEFVDITSELYNAVIEYDFGWADFKSSTSYLRRESDVFIGFDLITENIFGCLSGTGGLLAGACTPNPGALRNDGNVQDFTEEVTLSGKMFDDRLDWIVGGYYSNRDRDYKQLWVAPGLDDAILAINPAWPGLSSGAFGSTLPVGLRDNLGSFHYDIDLDQIAFFSELTYSLTDELRLTAGVRVFEIETAQLLSWAGIGSGNPPAIPTSEKEDGVNPKFSIAYDVTDNILTYVTAAKGFRPGGTNEVLPFNTPACTAALAPFGGGFGANPPGFESDSLWNYEVGAKSTLMDGKMTLNGSFYYIDWDNIQVSQLLSDCGGNIQANAGSADGRGIELELTAQPLEGLFISAGGSYTDIELSEDFPQFSAVEGDNMPYVPRVKASALTSYSFPLIGDFMGVINFSIAHTGSSYELMRRGNGEKMKAYTIGNLRLGVEKGNWAVTAFVNNVWNEEADVTITDEGIRFPAGKRITKTLPRTIGLNVKANF